MPNEALDAEAERFCRDILANSWRATRAVKTLVAGTEGLSVAEGVRYELEHTEGRGPEMQERLDRMRKR